MNSTRFKIGVIGAGAIAAQVHIPAWQALSDTEIVGVVDAKLERAQEVAKKHGIANAFSDYRELLKVPGLDAVSVCSPNAFHAEQSIAALEAGINVLCEKPMAIKLADAEAMVAAAKRTGKLLMIGMTNRFRPDTEALRQYVADGLLGDVYYMKAGWLRRSGIPGYGSWFTNKDLAGGGCLLDIGVHFLDLALWVAGFPKPVSVTGTTFMEFGNRGKALGGWGADIYHQGKQRFDVDDLATAFIRLDNGAVLTLEVSWAAYVGDHGENYLKFLGTEGGAELSSRFGDNFPMRYYSEKNGHQYDSTIYVSPSKTPHWTEIAHFLNCVKGLEQPKVPLAESLIVAKVLDGIYRSAESGQEVSIKYSD